MITKTKRINRYDTRGDYYGDEVMINLDQLKTLTDFIYRNFEDEEREVRLMELENLTNDEANDLIYQYISANWR